MSWVISHGISLNFRFDQQASNGWKSERNQHDPRGFGNIKTCMNSNATRFAQIFSLNFDYSVQIASASVQVLLLEKARAGRRIANLFSVACYWFFIKSFHWFFLNCILKILFYFWKILKYDQKFFVFNQSVKFVLLFKCCGQIKQKNEFKSHSKNCVYLL